MAPPKSFYTLTINDNTVKSNGQVESASVSLPVTTLTAANYVAQKALIDTLQTAIDGVVIGNLAKSEVVIDREQLSQAPAATTLAQRENKLLIRYEGSVTHKKFRASIPTFDLTLLASGSEFLDITTGGSPGKALKDAFEAIVKSPDDGSEAVLVLSMQFVGRNT